MSSSSISLYGWDLTYSSVKDDVKTKEDLLIVIVHWRLVKYGFLCVGIGELMERSDDDTPSELLPANWNSTNNYALRYIFEDKLYNLFLTRCSTGSVIINLLHKTSKISCVEVKVNDIIKLTSGTLDCMIPTYKELLQAIDDDLIIPVKGEKKSSNVETQTRSSETSTAEGFQFGVPPVTPINYPGRPNPLYVDPLADPRQVGRADLDFFGRGGGMIFTPPPNRPGVAGGSVPPGARFDPFRPLGVDPPRGPRRPPDSDHFPPPGFDDMFM